MRTVLFAFCSLVILAGNSVSAASQKTLENLQSAYTGEMTASAKYAAFAEQAKKEGLNAIATMFEATSKSESIHAANHKAVLVKMGQAVEAFKPEFTVKTTKENIMAAIEGETYEISQMYPGFVSTAQSESAPDAVKSFRWAMDTEKKHNAIYKKALEALNSNKVKDLPSVYYVCPKCGNTYDTPKPEKNCSFCYTASSKFIKFGK